MKSGSGVRVAGRRSSASPMDASTCPRVNTTEAVSSTTQSAGLKRASARGRLAALRVKVWADMPRLYTRFPSSAPSRADTSCPAATLKPSVWLEPSISTLIGRSSGALL